MDVGLEGAYSKADRAGQGEGPVRCQKLRENKFRVEIDNGTIEAENASGERDRKTCRGVVVGIAGPEGVEIWCEDGTPVS